MIYATKIKTMGKAHDELYKKYKSVIVTEFSPDPRDERQAMIIDVVCLRRGVQEEGERRESPSQTPDWSY